jgi:hypothetical protein
MTVWTTQEWEDSSIEGDRLGIVRVKRLTQRSKDVI